VKNTSVLGSALVFITRIGKGNRPKRIGFFLATIATVAVVVASIAPETGHADQQAAPTFVKEVPPGYRDWKVVSVAHEAGDLNDIRAVLGNDIAIKAYREGRLPFPEGAIVGRIAWSYVSSEENNKTFGHDQSFVAGSPRSSTCNSWSRTQRSMPRPAAGDTRPSVRMANLPTRRLCRAVIPATKRSKIATLSSPVTPLDLRVKAQLEVL
jgi:hypothetical protein